MSAPPDVGPRFQTSTTSGISLDDVEFFLACATVFLAPMNFLRHPAIYITLSDVVASACLFVMLTNRSVSMRPLETGTFSWMVGLFFLISGLLISSIIYGSAERGLIVSAQYFVAYLIFPFVIVARPWWQVVILIKIFVLSIILVCIHGVYLIHIEGETNTRFVSGNGRLKSFLERENALAALIALTSSLVLWLGVAGCIRRWTSLLVLPLLIYGVMLTGSNTGLLTMVYGFSVYYLVTITWRRLALGAGGIFVLVAVIAAGGKEYLPAVFQERVLGALESGNIEMAGTFSHRFELMIEAQDMINDTILLGLGADQHRVHSVHQLPVHNTYLLIWSEGGLIAFVGFLLIIVSGFVVVIRALRQSHGFLDAACTFCVVTQYAAMVNAVAHVYARLWPATDRFQTPSAKIERAQLSTGPAEL